MRKNRSLVTGAYAAAIQKKEFGRRKNFPSLPPLGSTHAVQGRLLDIDASIDGRQDLDVIGTGAIWKWLSSQTPQGCSPSYR